MGVIGTLSHISDTPMLFAPDAIGGCLKSNSNNNELQGEEHLRSKGIATQI